MSVPWELTAGELHEIWEDLVTGALTWREWEPGLTCPDRQMVATEDAWQAYLGARDAERTARGTR
jgi:hypothetical protein